MANVTICKKGKKKSLVCGADQAKKIQKNELKIATRADEEFVDSDS